MSNNATYVSMDMPYELVEKASWNVAITAQNTGTTAWSESAGYRLGECDAAGTLYATPPWTVGRLKLDHGVSVSPGATGTFKGQIIAPADNKLTECLFRPLQEGVAAFGPVMGRGPMPTAGILVRREVNFALPRRPRGGAGYEIMNTGAYPMGPYLPSYNELRCWEWIMPRPVMATGGMIWTGVSHLNSQADIVAMLSGAGGVVLATFPWDFYAKA